MVVLRVIARVLTGCRVAVPATHGNGSGNNLDDLDAQSVSSHSTEDDDIMAPDIAKMEGILTGTAAAAEAQRQTRAMGRPSTWRMLSVRCCAVYSSGAWLPPSTPADTVSVAWRCLPCVCVRTAVCVCVCVCVLVRNTAGRRPSCWFGASNEQGYHPTPSVKCTRAGSRA